MFSACTILSLNALIYPIGLIFPLMLITGHAKFYICFHIQVAGNLKVVLHNIQSVVFDRQLLSIYLSDIGPANSERGRYVRQGLCFIKYSHSRLLFRCGNHDVVKSGQQVSGFIYTSEQSCHLSLYSSLLPRGHDSILLKTFEMLAVEVPRQKWDKKKMCSPRCLSKLQVFLELSQIY